MEIQGESTLTARFQRLKTDLKQWEREFQKQHGRVPIKLDIQASPSIQVLYREYARMKLKIQKDNEKVKNVGENLELRGAEEKENLQSVLPAKENGPTSNTLTAVFKPENSPRRIQPSPHLPISRSLFFPATCANSEDSEEDGSYISATPPKRIGPRLEQQSTPMSSYRPVRRPLEEISAGQSNEPNSWKLPSGHHSINALKRKAPEIDGPRVLSSTPAGNTSENILPRPEASADLGFVIKRRRPGLHFVEQKFYPEHDILPAGFSASILGSSSSWKDCRKLNVGMNGTISFDVEKRTPGVSAIEVSHLCTPSLHSQKNDGGNNEFIDAQINEDPHVGFRSSTSTPHLHSQEKDVRNNENVNTQLNDKLHFGSSETYPSSERGEELASGSQHLPSSLLPEVKVSESINVPVRNEVAAATTGRGNGSDSKVSNTDSTGKTLQKHTVVILRQMLQKRGLQVSGNKAALIQRLTAALIDEGGPAPLGKMDEKDRGQSEESKAAPHSVKKIEKDTKKEDSGYAAEEIESPGLRSLRNGKVVGDSPAAVTRSGTRSGRRASTADDKLPFSLEKDTSCTVPESGRPGDVEVAGSVPSNKRVKKRSPTEPDDSNSAEIMDPPREADKDATLETGRKRMKLDTQPEEPSWSKPKALQRRSGARITKSTSNRTSGLGKSQALKPGERNNFVKLNINGRGGGRRKFVNKTRFRRPGAYGRRGYRGKKSRRPAEDEADGELEEDLLDEVEDAGTSERRISKSRKTKSVALQQDARVDADVSPSSVEDGKIDLPAGLSEALERVLQNPTNDILLEVLELAFGFKAFRAGQLEAVKRVLALQSTMVMLPTGGGKSLCYQLPALVLPGVTLVISPLIALMADQLRHLPPSLPGALMSSAQTPQESNIIVSRLRGGLIKILFISPERLCSESFQGILTEIPKIHLAVVDEAHCLSEWSHNFRPSYFRLGSVLLQRMKVPCVLAMTATATKKAECSIMEALRIPSSGLVQASSMRDNLVLTVSKEPNRLKALLKMLQESPFCEARSIIIYCTFQVEADNISDFLQQSGIQAKSYHAKKTSQERSRILDQFCSNKLRVVVATVAFGMGVDKSDVRAVIHYNMPRSLEHYVQETGRAGRDGKPAFCHLFLDDNDYLKLRSLAHSEGVDEYAVGKVLSRIFSGKQETSKLGSLTSLVIEAATKEFDMKEEVLETILSYLEVGDVEYLKSVSKLHVTCNLTFHRSSPSSLAETSRLITAILQKSQERQGRYVFDMSSVATHLRLSISDIQFELRRLQAAGEVSCEFCDPAFCFVVSKLPEDVCLLSSNMTKRLNDVETCKVRKVDAMYTAALAAIRGEDEKRVVEESTPSCNLQQASFQNTIKQYFDEDEGSRPSQQTPSIIEHSRNFLRADIKDFIRSNKHASLTGRAIARIFYGIWSPAFPYSDWCINHSWGKYEGVDFKVIKDIASAELLAQHSASRAS